LNEQSVFIDLGVHPAEEVGCPVSADWRPVTGGVAAVVGSEATDAASPEAWGFMLLVNIMFELEALAKAVERADNIAPTSAINCSFLSCASPSVFDRDASVSLGMPSAAGLGPPHSEPLDREHLDGALS